MPQKLAKSVILPLVFIITSLSCYANTIDSLKSLLGDENDTVNYRVYKELGNIYNEICLDSALYFYQLGLELAKNQKDKEYISKFHNNIGAYYFYKGWYSMAIKHFELSKIIRDEIGDTTQTIRTLNNLGRSHELIGKYEIACNLLFQALNQAELIKDSFMVGTICGNIGLLYSELAENEKAINYYRKSLDISKSIKAHKPLADSYMHIGVLCQNQNKLDTAIYHFHKAKENYEKMNYTIGIIDILVKLSNVFLLKSNYSKALEYLNKASELFKTIGLNGAVIHERFGDYYTQTDNSSKALYFYKKSVNFYKENGSKIDMQKLFKKISEVYKSENNYDSALYYFELSTTYKDSIFTLEKAQQIAELEAIYQTEKKEKEILQLAKEKEQKHSQILLLSGFIGLLIILIVFTYIYYKTRQKSLVLKAITSEQKKQFKAVLGAQENERKRIAAELHDSVGPLLSVSQLYISELGESGNQPETESKQLCHKSLNALKEATQEIRDISHNLMPGVLVRIGLGAACRELIRKINDTKNHTISFEVIGYNKRLDETIELTFYRIFQELLNNILKHSKADKVEVNLSQKNSTLSLTVKDNGVGFNTKDTGKAKGIGLQSIYSRISLIGGEVEIDSGEKGTSTIVWAKI